MKNLKNFFWGMVLIFTVQSISAETKNERRIRESKELLGILKPTGKPAVSKAVEVPVTPAVQVIPVVPVNINPMPDQVPQLTQAFQSQDVKPACGANAAQPEIGAQPQVPVLPVSSTTPAPDQALQSTITKSLNKESYYPLKFIGAFIVAPVATWHGIDVAVDNIENLSFLRTHKEKILYRTAKLAVSVGSMYAALYALGLKNEAAMLSRGIMFTFKNAWLTSKKAWKLTSFIGKFCMKNFPKAAR